MLKPKDLNKVLFQILRTMALNILFLFLYAFFKIFLELYLYFSVCVLVFEKKTCLLWYCTSIAFDRNSINELFITSCLSFIFNFIKCLTLATAMNTTVLYLGERFVFRFTINITGICSTNSVCLELAKTWRMAFSVTALVPKTINSGRFSIILLYYWKKLIKIAIMTSIFLLF